MAAGAGGAGGMAHAKGEDKERAIPYLADSHYPAGRPQRPPRGSVKGEDKDSLTVGPRTALRRLDRRREDKDSPEFLIFPHSTTRPGGMSRIGKICLLYTSDAADE